MSRRSRQIAFVVTVSAVYLAGLIYYAHVRPIEEDEGFYATAARLVWQGKTPYRDFFYQQAPLLPYLYSWIWAIRPHSLIAMRTLSAVCGGLAVLLWGLALVSVPRLPARVALATFAAVTLNPYWASWNVVVKTYAVANLLMTVAMITLYGALRSGRARRYFSTGLALGICASVRSLYGPLIPVLAVWLLDRELRGKLSDEGEVSRPSTDRSRGRTRRAPKTAALASGAVCGLVPMIYSFVREPRLFIFNNIEYHHLDAGYRWTGSNFVRGYESAWHTALVYFSSLFVSLLALHPFFTAEIVFMLIGVAALRRLRVSAHTDRRGAELLYLQSSALMFVAYTLTAITPFPPFEQYFVSPVVPFLIPLVAEGLRATLQSGRQLAVFLALASILFFGEVQLESSGKPFGRPQFQLATYRTVAQVIRANSNPDDVVLAFWPGYVFESDRSYFRSLENNFVYHVMRDLGPAERAGLHVVSNEDVVAAISHRTVALVVTTPEIADYDNNLSADELSALHSALAANYSPIYEIDDVVVYRSH